MAEAAAVSARELRVFTHPACSGCTEAVKAAWEVAQANPAVRLSTVKLENEEGLAEARREKVTTIPTVILSSGGAEIRRWVGRPAPGELAAEVAAI